MININSIPEEFALLTKKGQVWRTRNGFRVDWSKLVGKEIELAFGTYMVVTVEGSHITLTDNEMTFTIERSQLKNKKLPKNAIMVEEVVEEVEVKHFEYQLCLPMPIEPVDRLLVEVNKVRKANRVKPIGQNARFKVKVSSIMNVAVGCGSKKMPKEVKKANLRKVYMELCQYYHTDKGNVSDDSYMISINNTYNAICRRDKIA